MHDIVNEDIDIKESSISDKKNITIGAIILALCTLCSRIFGMIRDVMLSNIFGASIVSDAYIAANTIPNVLRQFFAEGAFSVAFVPIYLASKEKDGQDNAKNFFKHAFGFLIVTVFIVTILGMIFADQLVMLFAYGFVKNHEQFALASIMTRWLFPYTMMVSIVALFGAYLSCYKKFAAMAFSPVLLNITMIIFMAYFKDIFHPAAMVLVVSVLCGGLLQVLLMTYAVSKHTMLVWPSFNINTEAMRKWLKMLGPALFGIFIYQLNIIILRQLASFLGEGQMTYYYNADRLAQFATGVFAVSIASAALPELSRSLAKYGDRALLDTLKFTLIISSFILTPCAFGLVVFAHPVIAVIFVHHAAFNNNDAIITAQALMGFAPSLIAFGWSRPLIQAFYAQGDSKTPVLVGIAVVFANAILGYLLLSFNVVGLATTLSISSFIQFLLLLYYFKKKFKHKINFNLLYSFSAHALISIIACLIGLSIASLADFNQGFSWPNVINLALLSLASASTYFLVAYYAKLPEARKFIDAIIKHVLSLCYINK